MKVASILFAVMFSSCAMLTPVASLHLVRVPSDYQLGATDTTKTILAINTKMHVEINLNGSDIIKLSPGEWSYVADGIEPGWYYLDVIGAETRVRNVPMYLYGGDEVPIDIGPDHLDIDGAAFFSSRRQRSTLYSFYPLLSVNCYGCTVQPQLKFDGSPMAVTRPWTTVAPGWHTIEIYSPFDHIDLYYRALFDNYTITQFDFYPVSGY